VVEDALQHVGRVIPFMSRTSTASSFAVSPGRTGLECFLLRALPAGRAIARTGLALFGSKPLLHLIHRVKPDVIVSTHPAATSILGYFRRRGTLDIPVLGDRERLRHPPALVAPVDGSQPRRARILRPRVERVAGTGSARVVRPFVQEKFLEPMEQADARRPSSASRGGAAHPRLRRRLGRRQARVRGARQRSSWRGANVVCICGLNEQIRDRLERDFAGEPRARILGFTNDMNELMAAADACRAFDRRVHVPRGARAR
jgi:hypothetical protein